MAVSDGDATERWLAGARGDWGVFMAKWGATVELSKKASWTFELIEFGGLGAGDVVNVDEK